MLLQLLEAIGDAPAECRPKREAEVAAVRADFMQEWLPRLYCELKIIHHVFNPPVVGMQTPFTTDDR